MTKRFLILAASTFVGCTGADDNSRAGEPPATQVAATDSETVSLDLDRALAGCERYWRRLGGEEPTPGMPPAMVSIAVEMLPDLVPDPDNSPTYVSLAVPGGIDAQMNQVPDPDYVDPWGNQYRLEVHSTGSARAVSAGPDGQLGTGDDVGFPATPQPLGSE